MGMHLIEPAAVEILKRQIRATSVARLQYHTGLKGPQVTQAAPGRAVRGHWMAIILASGKQLRITFKVYAMSRDVWVMGQNTYGTRRMSESQTGDFLKEFCNLSIGGLKIFLEQNQIPLGVSLPVITRGFDEVFSPPPVGKMNVSYAWSIQLGEGKIDCTAVFEIFETIRLDNPGMGDEDASEVEFL
jgi:hypothetical protein